MTSAVMLLAAGPAIRPDADARRDGRSVRSRTCEDEEGKKAANSVVGGVLHGFSSRGIIKMSSRRRGVVGETPGSSGFFPGALMRVRFGECVLDSDTRQLSVRGEAVHLSPKAFQFLELLLESRPKAVSKTRSMSASGPARSFRTARSRAFSPRSGRRPGTALESRFSCGPFTALGTRSAGPPRSFGEAPPPPAAGS